MSSIGKTFDIVFDLLYFKLEMSVSTITQKVMTGFSLIVIVIQLVKNKEIISIFKFHLLGKHFHMSYSCLGKFVQHKKAHSSAGMHLPYIPQ